MTQEQIENNRAFVKALRENKKKAKGVLYGSDGGRCCLGVAFDVAKERGFVNPDTYSPSFCPPKTMASFYGWNCEEYSNPLLGGIHATEHNDGVNKTPEKTHKEIADLFEQEYPEIKE